MSVRRTPLAAILVSLGLVALIGAGLPAMAGDPQSGESDEAAPQNEPKSETTTYTNEDLERMFGPAGPAPAKDPAAEKGKAAAQKGAAEMPDPLATIADQVAREEMRKKLTAEAEAEIAGKTAEVKRLEQRILKIKNPLLPRPEADMTPEEIGEWNGLGSAERVAATEERLLKARAELSEAEAKLEKLKSS